jgi:hypothetical protein
MELLRPVERGYGDVNDVTYMFCYLEALSIRTSALFLREGTLPTGWGPTKPDFFMLFILLPSLDFCCIALRPCFLPTKPKMYKVRGKKWITYGRC